MWNCETAAGSWSTMTVREGTTTLTALTPWMGARSRSTSATSAVQQMPRTSRYVFSHLPAAVAFPQQPPPPPSWSPPLAAAAASTAGPGISEGQGQGRTKASGNAERRAPAGPGKILATGCCSFILLAWPGPEFSGFHPILGVSLETPAEFLLLFQCFFVCSNSMKPSSNYNTTTKETVPAPKMDCHCSHNFRSVLKWPVQKMAQHSFNNSFDGSSGAMGVGSEACVLTMEEGIDALLCCLNLN